VGGKKVRVAYAGHQRKKGNEQKSDRITTGRGRVRPGKKKTRDSVFEGQLSLARPIESNLRTRTFGEIGPSEKHAKKGT